MSYQDPTGQLPYPVPPNTVAFEAPPLPAEDDYIDDDDEEWVNQAPKGMRVAPITGILFLVLFAVLGFWGGAVLQKHHDKKTATTTAASAFAGAAGRRAAAAAGGTGTGAAGGFGAFAGGGASRSIGTVSDVEGSTLFLTDSSGNLVKITLTPATKVTKVATGSVSDIAIGSTVVVTGGTGTSPSATTVIVEPPGTTLGGTGTGGAGTGGAGTGTGAGGGGAAG